MVDLPEEYKELVSGPENVDCGDDVHGGDHGRNGNGHGEGLNGVDDDGVLLGDDAYLQVNIAMTATYMIFGLSLFWMVFHLVQVNFRTSSSKCFRHSFHSFHSSRL